MTKKPKVNDDQVTVRLPTAMREEADAVAKRDQRSLAGWIKVAIARALETERAKQGQLKGGPTRPG